MKFKAKKTNDLKICLDISASDTGVAVIGIGGEIEYYSHYMTDPKEDYVRLLAMSELLKNDLDRLFGRGAGPIRYKNIFVYPEGVFIGPHGHSMIIPLMLHGILLAQLYAWAEHQCSLFYWNEVAVSTWRNWFLKHTGIVAESKKSKELKLATAAGVKKIGFTDVENQNTLDAIAMSWYVKHNL